VFTLSLESNGGVLDVKTSQPVPVRPAYSELTTFFDEWKRIRRETPYMSWNDQEFLAARRANVRRCMDVDRKSQAHCEEVSRHLEAAAKVPKYQHGDIENK